MCDSCIGGEHIIIMSPVCRLFGPKVASPDMAVRGREIHCASGSGSASTSLPGHMCSLDILKVGSLERLNELDSGVTRHGLVARELGVGAHDK